MKKGIFRHSTGYKQRYIDESAKFSTIPISKLSTTILSATKTRIKSYCDTSYSTGGVNQIWIKTNSKDLFEHKQSMFISSCNIIKTIDFSTHYTTIPH